METVGEKTVTSPPYMAWASLENILERMRTEGVPSRIDRSYLASWSGSAQAQFLRAAQFLELLDEYGRPTALLKQLATEPKERPQLIGQVIEQKYPEARALGPTATQQELEEVFRNYEGISGGTVIKAITFYLVAARFAGLQLSPFFRGAKGSGSASTGARRPPRRARTARKPVGPPSQKDVDENPPQPTDAMGELRKKYVETLLDKFAAANGEVDAELADRIERLVGFDSPKTD